MGGTTGSLADDPDLFYVEWSMDIGVGLWKTVYVRIADMEKGIWLKIPLETVSSVKLDVQAEAAGGLATLKTVEISPLTVQMHYTTSAGATPVIHFLWKDGTLSSFRQLNMRTESRSRRSVDEFRDDVKSVWKFGQVQDIRELEAIVFENMAYPLDGGEPYAYEIDPNQSLTPYTLPESK